MSEGVAEYDVDRRGEELDAIEAANYAEQRRVTEEYVRKLNGRDEAPCHCVLCTAIDEREKLATPDREIVAKAIRTIEELVRRIAFLETQLRIVRQGRVQSSE